MDLKEFIKSSPKDPLEENALRIIEEHSESFLPYDFYIYRNKENYLVIQSYVFSIAFNKEGVLLTYAVGADVIQKEYNISDFSLTEELNRFKKGN